MGTLVGFKRGSRECFLAGYGAFISLDRGVHVWSGVTSRSFYRKMLEWWQSRFFECVKTFIPFHMRRTRKYAIALEHWMLTLIPTGGGAGFRPTNKSSLNCYQTKSAGFIKLFYFFWDGPRVIDLNYNKKIQIISTLHLWDFVTKCIEFCLSSNIM